VGRRAGARTASSAAGQNRVGGEEVAVQSRGTKDGDRGKQSADGVNKSSTADEKGNKEEPVVESQRMSFTRFLAGVVDDGEERRKRPRFWWLADIYRETR
jgi:hypothetical protein